ncbi:MAG: glycosyltransferase family 2 protein [Candidatus Omnitrophica bacterium]|nr:glycosyltransferase family 2 protein [Candidatus Omnitrophota bacterium]
MRTDIIIPVWNLPQFTKECIESVFENTASPFHLIVVDNASESPTKDYLQKLAARHKDKITLLRNEKNLGFIKAVNRGIGASGGEYVCLLNNDTRVTKGWLEEIIKVAEGSHDIGIINANSNTLGCKPKKGQSIEALAEELKSYTGQYSELAWATGFCMLIKRKVIEKVGLFDEVFGMGNFEDADFCKRALERGYISVCARASYVYHRERQSFIKFKEFSSDFSKLRQTFYAKWGKTQRILYVFTKDEVFSPERGKEVLLSARQGNVIWVFLKEKEIWNVNHHSNIYVFSLPKAFFNPVSIWRIIKRKKKFNKIYVDDQGYGQRLEKFKPFHKAEVIYAG